MAAASKIEWTEATWNPVTGCSKISPGCLNCYAERMARRLRAMGQPNYRNGFAVTTHDHNLKDPLSWKKPKVIFVCSMSDLFHDEVPFGFIQKVFKTMVSAKQHRFQVLTKRSGRLLEVCQDLPWPENIWLGVSVEDADHVYRIEDLRRTPAVTKFISFEPLLGPVPNLNLGGIDWLIVGGESGPGARPMAESWVKDLRDQTTQKGGAFFFKQWGGVNKKKAGRLLEGKLWDQMPQEHPRSKDKSRSSLLQLQPI